jgi:hypothetical protein
MEHVASNFRVTMRGGNSVRLFRQRRRSLRATGGGEELQPGAGYQEGFTGNARRRRPFLGAIIVPLQLVKAMMRLTISHSVLAVMPLSGLITRYFSVCLNICNTYLSLRTR